MMRDERLSMFEQGVPVAWPSVLEDWRLGEEGIWESVFKDRGFDSWWEWRKSYVEELGLEEREWTETMVHRPHEVIPSLAIGGYRGWKKYRPAGKDVALYADVVRPVTAGELSFEGTPRVDVRTNEKVMGFVGNLRDTTLLVLRSGDLSVVLDGAHRCAATAVEAQDGGERSAFMARLRTCTFQDDERALLEAFAKDRSIVVKKPDE